MGALAEKIAILPAVPGVYLFKDALGEVLYVGKARSLAARVRSYLAPDPERPRMEEMIRRAADVDTIVTASEAEALLLESTLIRQHRPHFNVLLKDDKSFPFVKLSVQEEFPRLSVTRRVRDDGARYLGPFTDVKNLRRTLRDLRRVFPLRTCRNFEDYRRQGRPCLYYHIKRCAGPCYSRARVRPEDYRRLVDGLLMLLSGRNEELLGQLRREMNEASAGRRYEIAAQRRDQLRLLERAQVPQTMVTSDRETPTCSGWLASASARRSRPCWCAAAASSARRRGCSSASRAPRTVRSSRPGSRSTRSRARTFRAACSSGRCPRTMPRWPKRCRRGRGAR